MLAHAKSDKPPSPETVEKAHKNAKIGDAFGGPKFPKSAGDPVYVGE